MCEHSSSNSHESPTYRPVKQTTLLQTGYYVKAQKVDVKTAFDLVIFERDVFQATKITIFIYSYLIIIWQISHLTENKKKHAYDI